MVELAEQLVDAGHAYVSAGGNVYYAVASFPDYGALSGNTLDALRAGHRGEVEADKRDAADFALWKAAGEGRLLKWPTPRWGEGYPGWHLECSAMALKHLGPRFDVHTGGIDNVFPHHEDEIAQSAPIVGGPPARVWVHGEFLQVGGQKMAKSAGNIERIADVADRGIDPLAFRYLALTSRYRHKLEYTPESLAGAAAGLSSLRDRLRALGEPPADGPWQAPPRLRAGEAPARPIGHRRGHGRARRRSGHRADRSSPRADRSPLRRWARPPRPVRRRRSTTTWTCRPRSPWSARPSARPIPDDERTVARPRRRLRPRAGPRPRLGYGGRRAGRHDPRRTSWRSSRSGPRHGPPATSSAPTSCATDLANAAGRSSTARTDRAPDADRRRLRTAPETSPSHRNRSRRHQRDDRLRSEVRSNEPCEERDGASGKRQTLTAARARRPLGTRARWGSG